MSAMPRASFLLSIGNPTRGPTFAYHFIMGENELFAAKGVETIKIAVAIALGIVLVLSLPTKLFAVFAPNKKSA